MFKLVVLSILFTFAAARPGLYASIPAYASVAVHQPLYAHVGSVVKSVPTAVSHQSQSVVHGHAHFVQDVLAPAVKSTVYSIKSLVAPIYKTYTAPAYFKTFAAPVIYKSYAAEAPVLHKSW